MRGSRNSGFIAVALTLCAGLGAPASARESACETTRTGDIDQRNILDLARGIARPRRLAPETFEFCGGRSLGGRWERATVETVRRRQPDGGETWLLILCQRHYGDRKWPCEGYEARGVRVPVTDATGKHVYAVEIIGNDASSPMDAALARELVVRAFEAAQRSSPALPNCEQPGGGDFAKAWSAGREVRVWFNDAARPVVSREGGAHLEFSRSTVPAGSFEPTCWREAVLVVE